MSLSAAVPLPAAHFYPGWCFALPELILNLPLTMAETWIWTLMVGARLFLIMELMIVLGA